MCASADMSAMLMLSGDCADVAALFFATNVIARCFRLPPHFSHFFQIAARYVAR
jgi:hypothetical protein